MSIRPAVAALAGGLAVIALAQMVSPLGSPPLYDGVVVQDTYRYLEPGPGQAGSPTSFQKTVEVPEAPGILFAAATAESPPQAQLIAAEGALAVPPGTTSLEVSIQPVKATASPSTGRIVGNVYRFAVKDPSGASVPVGAQTLPSLVMRAPDGAGTATIASLSGGSWRELTTNAEGQPGIYLTNVDALGDFALIEPENGLLGLDPTIVLLAAATAAISIGLLGALLHRATRPRTVAPTAAREAPASKRSRRGARR